MNIPYHVRELLFFHECVIIPGFGGFITNYRNAQIKEHNNSFTPPTRDLSFNRNLLQNDGLLINHVATHESISYSTAKERIEKYVLDCLRTVYCGDPVEFEGLGIFTVVDGGVMQFTPDVHENLLIESFGFSTFQFPAIQESEVVIRKKEVVFTNRESVRRTAPASTFRKVMIAIPVLLAFAMIPYKTVMVNFKPNFSSIGSSLTETTFVPPETLLNNPESVHASVELLTNKKIALFYSEEKTKPTDSLQSQNLDSIILSEANKAFEISEPESPIVQDESEAVVIKPEIRKEATETEATSSQPIADTKETVTAVEKGPVFHIIAGSFNSKRQAKDWSKRYEEQGIAPEVLDADKGRYRISIGRFTNKEKANQELQKFRDQNLSVWLLTSN